MINTHNNVPIGINTLYTYSTILRSESNLRPIWLNNLDCTSSDSSLLSCVTDMNIIGFVSCQRLDIAAVDCGEFTRNYCW